MIVQISILCADCVLHVKIAMNAGFFLNIATIIDDTHPGMGVWQTVRMMGIRVLVTIVACTAIAGVVASPASAGSAWGFAGTSITFTRSHGLMTSGTLANDPNTPLSRRAFVMSLAALDTYRAAQTGTPSALSTITRGATLSDVGRTSVQAKSVLLGWLTPIGDNFAGSQAITANEATKGIIGVLGLRDSAVTFALKIRNEVPGTSGINTFYKATQVYARALGLRYNHLVGYERFEVSPSESMRVGHIAYMLHKAATVNWWRINSVRQYETFNLPALGTNQAQVLRSGVRLIGYPYVWAGETEYMQPEGHGGFDCSGFTLRSTVHSGVSAGLHAVIGTRTSMGMSGEIPTSKRIYRVADLRPGDYMFWGDNGPRSTPSQNFHVGVYMGNGWFIHSSGGNGGVTITQLDGWWRDKFSWGRKFLRVA